MFQTMNENVFDLTARAHLVYAPKKTGRLREWKLTVPKSLAAKFDLLISTPD